jgi:hypothetical protein
MRQAASITSTAAPGTRARHRRFVAGRHLPPLRAVPDFPCRSAEVSPGELVADLAVLLDAGLVSVAVDTAGEPGYAVVEDDDIFTGTGTTPIAIFTNGGAA